MEELPIYKDKMTVGVLNNDLMVRVISDRISAELKKNQVRPMDFNGKNLKEFIFVSLKGCQSEEQLQGWIELGLEHAKHKLKKY